MMIVFLFHVFDFDFDKVAGSQTSEFAEDVVHSFWETNGDLLLEAMASNLIAMASTLVAMASNLLASCR